MASTKESSQSDDRHQQRIRQANELFSNVQALFPNIEYLTYDKFNAMTNEFSQSQRTGQSDSPPVLLVDVREREEIQTATLEHAISVNDLNKHLEGVDDRTEQKIICFCTVGVRSGIQAEHLRQKGYTQVWNYSIMVHAWGKENNNDLDNAFVVQHGGKKWDGSIHVYANKYEQLLPSSLKAKYFSNWSALTRGLSSLPGILSAIGSSGRWKK